MVSWAATPKRNHEQDDTEVSLRISARGSSPIKADGFDGVGSRYQRAHNAQRRRGRCFIPESMRVAASKFFVARFFPVIASSNATIGAMSSTHSTIRRISFTSQCSSMREITSCRQERATQDFSYVNTTHIIDQLCSTHIKHVFTSKLDSARRRQRSLDLRDRIASSKHGHSASARS
jgi:hypothetical protein